MGIAEEGTKVHLILAVTKDTLSHLDMYVTMRGGEKMAYVEAVQDRLSNIPYVQILAYLNQSELGEIAR